MPQMIFVSLPVTNLPASMVWNETITAMLHTHIREAVWMKPA